MTKNEKKTEAAASEYVTPEEAAEIAGVARATVYGWIRRGLIKAADVKKEMHPIAKDRVESVKIRRSAVPKKAA